MCRVLFVAHMLYAQRVLLFLAVTAATKSRLGLSAPLPENCNVSIRSIQPERSQCSGNYVLRLRPWVGRLGNNLISLMNVLYLAQQTRSEVIVSTHDYLTQTDWDYTGRTESENWTSTAGRQIVFTHHYFREDEFPLRIHDWSFTTSQQRRILVNDVLPAFRLPPKPIRNSIVIHVRSGDVFKHIPHWHYRQPPYAFYQAVLQLPETAGRHILLCIEDHQNPVVDLLIQEYSPRVTVLTHLDDVVSAIIGAEHLVLAKGTFSENLGKMAPSLSMLYVPFCVDMYHNEDGIFDRRDGQLDATWNSAGYCFEFDNYIDLHDWAASDEQLLMMASMSVDSVRAYPLPVLA